MLELAFKQVAAQRFRLALTSLAVVLGVTFVSGTLVLTDTSQQLFDEKFATQAADTDLTVRTEVAFEAAMGVEVERDPVPATLAERIRDIPGVDGAAGVVSGKGAVLRDGEPVTSAGPLMLLSWTTKPFGGFTLVEGQAPRAAGDVVVDEHTAAEAGIHIGDDLKVQSDEVGALTVVGIARPTNSGAFVDSTVALTSPSTAQRLLRLGTGFSEIRVTAEPGTPVTEVERAVAEHIGGGYTVTSSKDIAEASAAAAQGQLSFLRMALLALAAAALLIGAYLIANTFSIVIAQRTRELALLRAAGATGGQVFRLLLAEALLVGVAGSAVGTVLGIGTAHVLRSTLGAFAVTLPEGSAVVRPTSMLVAFTTGLLVTLVAALVPSRRAARVSPLQAMRASAAARVTSRPRVVLGAVASVPAIGAAGSVLVGSGSTGLVVVSAISGIVAVSAVGPVVAGLLTRVVGAPLKASGVPGKLAGEFAARDPRRTAATVMGLTLSLALIVFMTVLAASVRGSIAESYRETITADLVIESAGGEMLGGLSPAVHDRLEELPEVAVASPMRFGHWKKGRTTTALTAVDPATIGAVATFELRDGTVGDLADGGVVVSAKVADTESLAVGDPLEMTFPRDGTRTLPVVGVFDDEALQAVQTDYLVSVETYEQHFTEDVDANVFLELQTGVDEHRARTAVEAALADFPTVDIRDQEAAVAGRTAVVDQILGLVTVLLVLTVVIALLGITNTLALTIVERTREIGLLRAVGMTDAQLRWMVRIEAVLLAALAVVLGTVVGVGYGAVTTRALSDGSTAMAVAVPGGRIAVMIAIATLAGLLAGLAPARRAVRLRLLEAVSA